MKACRTAWFAAVGVMSAALLNACVERKEQLQISPQGSVRYRLEYSSDSADDLYNGDVVPKPAGGWLASEEVQRHDDGKLSYRFVAETVFPPGSALPANYAVRTDPDADLYLQFPTTLKIERRRDGMYYHFSRVYAARPWAQIEALEDRIVRAPLADLKDIDQSQWTPAQRQMVARALAAFETEKMLVFARAAYRRATPEAAQDGWLGVQNQMRDCLNHLDYRALATALEPRQAQEDEKVRDEAVTAELKGFSESLSDQLKAALFTMADYSGAQYNAFMVEYDRQKKAYDVTEDLGDDKFEIKVEMPGQIVASNAESVDGTTATWTFDGGVVRDREMELMVTSRVPR